MSREWLGLPRWSRRGSSLGDAVDTASGLPYDMPVVDVDDAPSIVVVIVVAVVAFVILVVVTWLVLPLIFLVAGLAVALAGLAARLLSLAAWTVIADSGACGLSWRVRGVRRSARAMRDVATALARGATPTVDGIPGNAG